VARAAHRIVVLTGTAYRDLSADLSLHTPKKRKNAFSDYNRPAARLAKLETLAY
jgi:hypothetical protein